MFQNLFAIGVALCFGSFAFANQELPEQRPVVGGVQFWSRLCDKTMNCELPAAISEVYVVRGEISKPTSATEIGRFAHAIEVDGLRLELSVFWKNPNNEIPHFVYQQRLLRIDGKNLQPLAECSSYTSDQSPRAFPVGACTGYQAEGEGFRQWGASFIKAP